MVRRLTLIALVAVVLALSGCDEKAAPPSEAEMIAAVAGGKPLPAGKHEISFPWIGKQSLMCIGDAVERQIAFVDFTDGTPGKVGTVSVTEAGVGSGTFTVPIAMLRTGHDGRDTKLKNHN